MRIIVRRERPHPGAQLDAFEERDGYRYTAHATDTPRRAARSPRCPPPRHIEDRIRCGKNTGLGHFPSRVFAINAAWLTVVLLAADLLAWTQTLLLPDHPALARAEPKTLRYRLLHTSARITHGQRRTWLRLQQSWPWAQALADAFHRLAALPIPQT
ncbi:MAG: transposase [Pseudonocardiales bacterium]|nr:transposase [Pseudonocardiales bacterium]